jgi:molecular chaperone GrpE
MIEQEQEQDRDSENSPDELAIVEPDIETLKAALAEEKVKAESHLANWQRAEADLINYKRRSDQEKEEIAKFANTGLMLSLLPALDDLERAFSSIPDDLAASSWLDGIRLIAQKLRASLEAHGLSEIKALGEPFDPNFHEAVMQGKGEEGLVVEEMQKGYKLLDRVIRPARVVVGNGEKQRAKKEE